MLAHLNRDKIQHGELITQKNENNPNKGGEGNQQNLSCSRQNRMQEIASPKKACKITEHQWSQLLDRC